MSATNGSPATESTAAATQFAYPPALGASALRNIRVVLVLAMIVALVAVGLGAYQLTRPASATKTEIASLQRQVGGLKSQVSSSHTTISALQSDVTTLQSSSTAGQVTKLKNTISQFEVCVPQLQSEINGLNVTTDSQDGALTDAYLQNPTIISSNCEKVINGADDDN
jgi:cell division protein FtsL